MRFEDIKKLTGWEILTLLQKMTKDNAKLIKENSEIIQQILKSESKFSSVRPHQAQNNELLQKNAENLKLHNALLSFLKSLDNEDGLRKAYILEENNGPAIEEKEVKPASFEEYFEQTISGSISYNHEHLYFNSDAFRNKLIDYYAQIEEYEKCAVLAIKNYN